MWKELKHIRGLTWLIVLVQSSPTLLDPIALTYALEVEQRQVSSQNFLSTSVVVCTFISFNNRKFSMWRDSFGFFTSTRDVISFINASVQTSTYYYQLPYEYPSSNLIKSASHADKIECLQNN